MMSKKNLLFVAILIVMSMPAIWPIVTPGFFPMHDDTQVARVYEMFQALSSGQFPARWVPDLGYGYGYPIFNFYNPLAYYFGAVFMFLGFDALAATKIMFVFPVILAGVSMFVLARLALSRAGALLAGLLYVYAPYHAVQIYVRGAVAEYWAYAILPLVFYAIWKRKIILAGLALAALILSHNLTAFMSIPFILISPIFLNKKIVGTSEPRSRETMTHGRRPWEWRAYYWGPYTLLLIFALGLSAFFWLPATWEVGQTRVGEMVFKQFDPASKHLTTLWQLWSSPWGYGGSAAGIDDGLSFELGKIHLIGSIAGIAILLYCYIAKKKTIQQFNPAERDPAPQDSLTIFSAVGLLTSLFLLLQPSKFIWDNVSVLQFIQFPWRFLTFASFFSSVLTASVISKLTPNRLRWPLFTVYCLLFTVYSIRFFRPQFKYPTSAAQLTSSERILWEVSRRSDEYLPIDFIRPITLEEALRVNNPANQILVDELKKPTPVRRLGNIISAITIISMIGHSLYFYRPPERPRA